MQQGANADYRIRIHIRITGSQLWAQFGLRVYRVGVGRVLGFTGLQSRDGCGCGGNSVSSPHTLLLPRTMDGTIMYNEQYTPSYLDPILHNDRYTPPHKPSLEPCPPAKACWRQAVLCLEQLGVGEVIHGAGQQHAGDLGTRELVSSIPGTWAQGSWSAACRGPWDKGRGHGHKGRGLRHKGRGGGGRRGQPTTRGNHS